MFKSLATLQTALDHREISSASLLSFIKNRNEPFRWHPLGFIVCTLMVEGPWKARLHCWPSGEARPQGEACLIHDHVFDFSSWVLNGEIENVEYEVGPSGRTYAIYATEYMGELSILKKTAQTIQLAVRSSTIQLAGSKYEMQAGQLHESRRIGTAPAVTVLITHNLSMQAPTVVGPLDGAAKYEYVRSILSDADVRRALTDI